MSDIIQKTLHALKDVQGIQGSFVLNPDGALLAMEMPSLFDAPMFADLGPRIERLAEGFSSLGDELESCLIRFSDHMLCVKQFPKGGALCILTEISVNLPALKMASNLAHRKLTTEVETAQPLSSKLNGSVVVPPSAVAPSPPPPAAQAAPLVAEDDAAESYVPRTVEHATAPRYYRGQLIDD